MWRSPKCAHSTHTFYILCNPQCREVRFIIYAFYYLLRHTLFVKAKIKLRRLELLMPGFYWPTTYQSLRRGDAYEESGKVSTDNIGAATERARLEATTSCLRHMSGIVRGSSCSSYHRCHDPRKSFPRSQLLLYILKIQLKTLIYIIF